MGWFAGSRTELAVAVLVVSSLVALGCSRSESPAATPIALQKFASCAVAPGGTVACWGGGEVEPAVVPDVAGATSVSAGNNHVCALVEGGAVTCWGHNGHGQLGDGTVTMHSDEPVDVVGLTGAVALASGPARTCALLSSGRIKCWGSNVLGGLGDGTNIGSAEPVEVVGIADATAIAGGGVHSCAVVGGGNVQCWGNNDNGQLGDGTKTHRSEPVAVRGISGATAVATGSRHSCAVVEGGAVKCWGNNVVGQLGRKATRDHDPVPSNVKGAAGASVLAAARDHTCAIVDGGEVQCWGANEWGQLGNGRSSFSELPNPVVGVTGATALSVHEFHSCAFIAGGSVKCWGNNSNGELGNPPTSTFETIAVDVIGVP
jgi:alpha-tubulin suppressor-like RCC1 family protein